MSLFKDYLVNIIIADIMSVSPNNGSVMGGTRLTIAVSGGLGGIEIQDIQVLVGGKNSYS